MSDIETTAVTVRQDAALATELSTDDIIARLRKIEDVQRQAMKPKIDYGVIPGTVHPTLLKPGAEKLCVLFRLDPQFANERMLEDGHLTVYSTCTIYHQVTGQRLGSASNMCSTLESKYRYRKGERICPECGNASIIKGKEEFGGGWLCWKKKDGCGRTYGDEDPVITKQVVGRILNEDPADQFPTVLRMAEKRALVAAVRLVTGASAIFDEEIAERESDAPEAVPEPPRGHAEGSDLASIQQKKALTNSVLAYFQGDEKMSRAWILSEMRKQKAKFETMTCDQLKTALDAILNMSEAPAREPGEENLQGSFDEAEGRHES